MKTVLKTITCSFLLGSILCCSGPEAGKPAITEKRQLPEKADSLKLPPKDGTDTESDTTSG